MRIEMPEKVKLIIETLQAQGFEAYAVGGCVRDAMLGRVPHDWDVTTSALPYQVKELFRRTIDTGIVHGTVTVMLDKEGFEVTTYRVDGEYEDGRHPKEVSFTASLSEDLRRRDFTINAMAYNDTEGLVDLFDGAGDLQNKVIRCVGEAKERFSEDALRILRAFRFSAQLDFSIAEDTLLAAKELAQNLRKISAERIFAELSKLLVSDHPERLLAAYRTGVTKVILPEFDRMMETPQNHPAHRENVGMHCLSTTDFVTGVSEFAPEGGFSENDFRVLRLAAVFHDVGKPACRETDADGIDHFKGHAQVGATEVKKILQRLKTDNYTMDTVTRLVQYHDYPFLAEEKAVRRAMNKIGPELFPMLFVLRTADLLAHNEPYASEGPERMRKTWECFRRIREKGECTSLKELAVSGSDLIAAGFLPGKQLGDLLQNLLEVVLEDPEKNDRQTLLSYAGEHYGKK